MWLQEAEVDKDGRRKVVPIETFDGVFKDSEGKLHDLRPTEQVPTLGRFMAMDKPTLWRLLKKAYVS